MGMRLENVKKKTCAEGLEREGNGEICSSVGDKCGKAPSVAEMGFEMKGKGYHLFVGRTRRMTLYSATV